MMTYSDYIRYQQSADPLCLKQGAPIAELTTSMNGTPENYYAVHECGCTLFMQPYAKGSYQLDHPAPMWVCRQAAAFQKRITDDQYGGERYRSEMIQRIQLARQRLHVHWLFPVYRLYSVGIMEIL